MTLEPWIEHDKRRGTFQVRWRNEAGKEERDRGYVYRNRSDAKVRKNIIRTKLVEGSLGHVSANESIKKCFDDFMECKKNERMSKIRLKVYRQAYDVLSKIKTISMMADITKSTILNYRNQLYGRGYALDTIIGYMSMTRAFLNWAVENGRIAKNPFKEIKRAIPKREPHPRFYTDEEIRDFERVIDDPEFIAMCRLGYMAGLRDGEIFRIEAADVAWHPRDNAGDLKIYGDESKTGEPRLVPLAPTLYHCLPKPKSGLLFPDWDYVKLRYHFNKAQALAGILDKILPDGTKIFATFYGFRHTFARVYLEDGGNIRELQEILGHKSLRMMEVYAHFGRSHLRKRIGAMRDLSQPIPLDVLPRTCGAMAGQNGQIYDTNGNPVRPADTIVDRAKNLSIDGNLANL